MNNLDRYTELDYQMIKDLSGVYIIENRIDGKRYVGETKTLGRRIKTHLQELIDNRHSNIHLQRAVNLHGIEQFKFDVIELCEPWETKRREHHWATILYVLDDRYGYNILPTDPDGKRHPSIETRRRQSIVQKGKKRTPEQIEKMRILSIENNSIRYIQEALKNKPRVYTDEQKEAIRKRTIGRKHTEEAKNKISVIHKGKEIPEEELQRKKQIMTERYGKAVVVLTKEGEYITEYSSQKEAARQLNIRKGTIGPAIQRNRTVKGYMFISKDKYSIEEVNRVIKERVETKKIANEKIRIAAIGRVQSKEAIAKRVAKVTGRKSSPESIIKRKLTLAAKGKYNHSEETKRKIAEKAKGRRIKSPIIVYKYSDDGTVEIFETYKQAAESINTCNSEFCKQMKKLKEDRKYKGYKWEIECIKEQSR